MSRETFYVLIRAGSVIAVNWGGHGPSGVYIEHEKEPGDKVIKVQEVLIWVVWQVTK